MWLSRLMESFSSHFYSFKDSILIISLVIVLSLCHLQVCQFVVSVNGLNVLNLDYRTVSHLILTGPRTVVMEVMEETEHWGARETLTCGRMVQYRSWEQDGLCSGFNETLLKELSDETGENLSRIFCWTDGGHCVFWLVGWRFGLKVITQLETALQWILGRICQY